MADAIVVLFFEDMDEAEAAARSEASAAEIDWLERRLQLQRAAGEPCHSIRRWSAAPAHRLPDIPAPASVSEIPAGYVCPQLRLFDAAQFTDDCELLFVGPERTVRGLRVWRRLVRSLNLRMAIPEKRYLGTWSVWLGVLLISGLGLVVVPRAKILRASVAVTEVLERGVEFHVYRSLCGLLEHLRAINLRGRNVMHGLYQPMRFDGASADGPRGRRPAETE